MARRLTAELFMTVIDMVAGHLRIREADRWGPQIARLKFRSFVGEFPEVSEQQFVWAAERVYPVPDLAGTDGAAVPLRERSGQSQLGIPRGSAANAGPVTGATAAAATAAAVDRCSA